jgi:hypothetical protein
VGLDVLVLYDRGYAQRLRPQREGTLVVPARSHSGFLIRVSMGSR